MSAVVGAARSDGERRGEVGEVEGFALLDASLADRQAEEAVDQPFLLCSEVECFFAGGSTVVGGCVWVREGDLQQGSLTGKWRAQFVGGVGDEVAL